MPSVATLSPAEIKRGTPELIRHRADPIAFFRDILGIKDIHAPMVELAEAVRDHERVAVAGCHDSSKSFTLAALAWWWVCCWQPGFVITTSASQRQVEHGLWKAMRQLFHQSLVPLGGELAPKAPQWTKDHETFILGFTTTEDTGGAGATRFQGFKAENRLVIMDEAVVIPRGAWESIDAGLMGGPHPRLVAAANPTDPACEMSRCWRPGSGWKTINISAYDNPNLKAGSVLFDYLMTPDKANYLLNRYGEGHPLYQGRVLGQFPDEAITTLISVRDWRAACDRAHGDITAEKVGIGCDVALQGDDLTVIMAVKGSRPLYIKRLSHRKGDEIGAELFKVMKRFNIQPSMAQDVAIDSTGGYGEAPANYLRREHGYVIREENFASRPVCYPDNPKERLYLNRRAEMWSCMAEWIRDEAALKGLPEEYIRWLEDDLPGTLADHNAPNAVLRLEKKEDMKKRLGHSPDHGDALALALSWRTARRYAPMPDIHEPRESSYVHPDDDPTDIDHPDHEFAESGSRVNPYSRGAKSPYR